MRKTFSVVLAAAVVVGAFFALPAEAKKKKNKPVPCSAYAPGEMGAAAETVVLTDTATEEAPVEAKVTHAMSTADIDQGLVSEASHAPLNIQVDSKLKDAGLYVLLEFPSRNDYDIYLYYPTGEEAASSHGFNTLIEAKTPGPFDLSNSSTNHAGESTSSSEKLIGVHTTDCGGWTLDTVNWLGQGGEMTVKMWLGEIANEPLPPGGA